MVSEQGNENGEDAHQEKTETLSDTNSSVSRSCALENVQDNAYGLDPNSLEPLSSILVSTNQSVESSSRDSQTIDQEEILEERIIEPLKDLRLNRRETGSGEEITENPGKLGKNIKTHPDNGENFMSKVNGESLSEALNVKCAPDKFPERGDFSDVYNDYDCMDGAVSLPLCSLAIVPKPKAEEGNESVGMEYRPFKLPSLVNLFEVAKAQGVKLEENARAISHLPSSHDHQFEGPNSSDGSNSETESLQASSKHARCRKVIFQ